MSHLATTIFSYSGSLMLAVAALFSLLLVILFGLLHIYAKYWLLLSIRHRHSHSHRRPSSRNSALAELPPSQSLTHITYAYDTPGAPSKGLDSSTISSIPLFVYKCRSGGGGDDSGGYNLDSECVICLSAFDEGDVGRSLPECGHGFHVDCIDMWLHCHTGCPICRASAVVTTDCLKDEKLKKVTTVSDDGAAVPVAEDVNTTPHSTTTAIQQEECAGILEIVIHAPDDGTGGDSAASSHSHSSSSSLPSSSSRQSTGNYGCSSSQKRLLSRSRSEMSKIHPSSSVHVDLSDSCLRPCPSFPRKIENFDLSVDEMRRDEIIEMLHPSSMTQGFDVPTKSCHH